MHSTVAFELFSTVAAGPWSSGNEVLGAATDCKCTVQDECWPSVEEFNWLNDTVGGHLIRGVPPGSVCYSDQPNYDEERCLYVLDNWLTSDLHANDPISVAFPEWAGNPCPPIYPNGTSVNGDPNAGGNGCYLGSYPEYALNATSMEDIKTIVRFAKDHNIRLNVKATGHSCEGRSTAPDAISIWTHHYQSTKYLESFRPDQCPDSYPEHTAVETAAGTRLRALYEFGYDNNIVVTGGSAEDVGIMGWFTGGGHGPLTSMFGQGTDNVLQITMVTPEGDVVTANECQNEDLFWAVRGGGGGTFGVITHVTMRAYPSPSAVHHRLDVVPSSDDEDGISAFWGTIAGLYSFLPDLKRQGFAGNVFMDRPPYVPELNFWWNFNLIDTNSEHSEDDSMREAESALGPLIQYLNSQDAVSYTSELTYFPTWYQSWNRSVGTEPSAVAAAGIAMASRLIPESAFSGVDNGTLARHLQDLSASVDGFQAHLATHNPSQSSPHLSENPSVEELNRTALPAHWRSALLQIFTVTTFPDNVTAEEEDAVFQRTTNGPGRLLKEIAPTGGAYFNEADAYDPDWKTDFFGQNYEALLRVKNQVDPNGQLRCVTCVGSDEWIEDGNGRLCRAI